MGPSPGGVVDASPLGRTPLFREGHGCEARVLALWLDPLGMNPALVHLHKSDCPARKTAQGGPAFGGATTEAWLCSTHFLMFSTVPADVAARSRSTKGR